MSVETNLRNQRRYVRGEITKAQYLRRRQQCALMGISERTLAELTKNDPTFPAEIRLSQRVFVRRRAELETWIESRKVRTPEVPS